MDAKQTVRIQGTDYGMFEAVERARDWFHDQVPAPARVRVVGDDDSDGVASAHVVSTALRRAGYETKTALRALHEPGDVGRALSGQFDAAVVADCGSALLEPLDALDLPILVLDHHTVRPYKPKNVFEVNPRRQGGDKVWSVSASVVSTLFAVATDRANWDTASAGIAGGISDRQHLGGFQGLLDYCVEGAVGDGGVQRRSGLTLIGPTVLDAVTGSVDPYFADLAGDAGRTGELLASLGVDPSTDPMALSDRDARALAGSLDAALARQKVVTDRTHPLYGEQLPMVHPSGVRSVFALARLLEATTAANAGSVAFRLLAGNRDAAEEAELLAQQRQRRSLEELRRLQGSVTDGARVRWVESRDGENTGLYAHALLTFVLGDDKPVVVFARTGQSLRASTRGSPRLFLAGLNLAVAVSEAAKSVGGVGGGHPGAAGATIPPDRRDEFLLALERALAKLSGAAR